MDSFESLAEDLIAYADHLGRSREAWEASAKMTARYGAILGEEYLRITRLSEKKPSMPKTRYTFGPD